MTEYKKVKYLIIGGGITGISLARLMQMRGIEDYVVLEADKVAGGLCRTEKIGEHYLDIGGGHFLYSKYPEVYEFIFSHIPKGKFNYYDRVSKVKLGDNYIDYPVESNLWQLPVGEQVMYLMSVVKAGEVSGKKEPKNYEEWIRWKLGDMVADNYMIPYNSKIWGVSPKEMSIDWLHKIPSINISEILEYSIRRKADVSKYPSHPGFYYPKNGGFQTIFDAIYEKVKGSVVLNSSVKKMINRDGLWVINDKIVAENVVNTAPWSKLFHALGAPKQLKKYFDNLKSTSLVVSLWEEDFTHNWHWLYDPSLSMPNHREFYVNNFSASSKKNGMYTETNLKRWPGKGCYKRNGHNPVYEYVNKNAYPIPVIGHTQAIKELLSFYEKLKLYGVGRWGQWQYLNADACIKEAINFVGRLGE